MSALSQIFSAASSAVKVDGRTLRRAKVDEAFVVDMYRKGHSLIEVAAMIKGSRKLVTNVLSRAGEPIRPAVARPRFREQTSQWKGDDAGYTSMHNRVRAIRGTPSRCDVCGTTDASKTYDWANLTGRYNDVNDFKRMCRSCHRKYDASRRPVKRCIACGEPSLAKGLCGRHYAQVRKQRRLGVS